MTKHMLRRTTAAASWVALALFTMAAHADPSNKWRIKLNHSANNAGTLVFRISPVGGTPIDVQTQVPAKTSENQVARLVRDSLKVSLGKDFAVATDDGEDVLIKKRGKTPNFDLELVSSSLTGLEIRLHRE